MSITGLMDVTYGCPRGDHASASDPQGLEESRDRGMSDSSEPRRSAVTGRGDAPSIRCQKRREKNTDLISYPETIRPLISGD
jgi:hypothetical protein